MEGEPDYQLVWPRRLFQVEAAALLNSRDKLSDWEDRCELLLEDAFAGVAPRDDFRAEDPTIFRHEDLTIFRPEDPTAGRTVIDHRQYFLLRLLRRAPSLREATVDRTPYWSERQRSRRPGAVSLAGTAREFVRVVDELTRLNS